MEDDDEQNGRRGGWGWGVLSLRVDVLLRNAGRKAHTLILNENSANFQDSIGLYVNYLNMPVSVKTRT